MDPSKCPHTNKYYYDAGDGKRHWICQDCSTTDLG